MARTPSAQEATALLSRARYASHHGEYVWLSSREYDELVGQPPPGGDCTMFGVVVAVDTAQAQVQTTAAIAHPAPPLDWEVSGG